ncbi:MAG: DEAD/DEAH box helicase family protein [Vallitaleaceae bacterium]|jgi:superfamily II DNA or RNA helicase|nr:DEAD/DEAH box helicase family protein [Vallitaleaceae bacterium]
MGTFHEDIKFIYPWRAYQQRILDELHNHMADQHIHVVASPGSGKTVLGLELMLRMDHPVLIFAPTLTIRNQWADRFLNLFVPENLRDAYKAKISYDIRDTKLINIITYQSLHALYRKLDGEGAVDSSAIRIDDYIEEVYDPESEAFEERAYELEDEHDFPEMAALEKIDDSTIKTALQDFISRLKQSGIRVLILDEAHHLRHEWWKALIYIKEHLKVEQVVALTATPPYDSSVTEWDKYISLCGDIDTEIYVPELVKNGDLCPHQDYIYFSAPDIKEQEEIDRYRAMVGKTVDDIKDNKELVGLFLEHPLLGDIKEHYIEILEAPAYYASIVAYLENYIFAHEEAGVSVFLTKVKLLIRDLKGTLGLKAHHLVLDNEKLTILLQQVIFQDNHIKTSDG